MEKNITSYYKMLEKMCKKNIYKTHVKFELLKIYRNEGKKKEIKKKVYL